MRTFLYRCPRTSFQVQGHVETELDGPDRYVAMQCPMCSQMHLVNPLTGKLLTEEHPPKRTS